ncbi:hypothetical protein BH23CHL8_BH23CHL8_26220 [soil metagenome]
MGLTCPHCGDARVDLECYRIGGDEAWLCPGCVADARRAGYRVVWLPGRMRSEQADAFRDALVTQAAIEAEQERRGREAEERWSRPPVVARARRRAA